MVRNEKEKPGCVCLSSLPGLTEVTPWNSPAGTNITNVPGVTSPVRTPRRPHHPHDVVQYHADIPAVPLHVSPAQKRAAPGFINLVPTPRNS